MAVPITDVDPDVDLPVLSSLHNHYAHRHLSFVANLIPAPGFPVLSVCF